MPQTIAEGWKGWAITAPANRAIPVVWKVVIQYFMTFQPLFKNIHLTVDVQGGLVDMFLCRFQFFADMPPVVLYVDMAGKIIKLFRCLSHVEASVGRIRKVGK